MYKPRSLTRRSILESIAAAGAFAAMPAGVRASAALGARGTRSVEDSLPAPLEEFRYEQVRVYGAVQQAQRQNVTDILLGLSDDSLMQPFRAMAGKPAPGTNIGGWYEWLPDYDFHHGDAGFAPGHSLGQWISAMARLSAADPERGPDLASRARRVTALLANDISPEYFAQTRFAAYSLEKLACGMVDMHRVLHDPGAYAALTRIADAAEPSLAGHAVDREVQWKIGKDISWLWDENFTLPENLLKAGDDCAGSAEGKRFRHMGEAYLNDANFFEPLARGENRMADRHAYSYVNSLCSAMQMHFSTGSAMHLRAAVNGFRMLQEQSFATGGWGPEENLRKQGYDELYKSLTASHNGFETPCGSFAHAKLTRYLLRATRDGRYGDSMERVLLNTTMGCLPLQADGRSFYSSDYNVVSKRVYSVHRWPCCSGTLPQVVADYGINGYLQSPGTVWVNLYQPSELRWKEAGVDLRLRQTGGYPADGEIRIEVTASRPAEVTLKLRIPAWSTADATAGPVLRVNGRVVALQVEQGFAAVHRTWRTGDYVALTLPMPLRLEALPANGGVAHPNTVALLYGPIVLFALREPSETGVVSLSRAALLAAKRTGEADWSAEGPAGTRKLVPFTQVGDRNYCLYVEAL